MDYENSEPPETNEEPSITKETDKTVDPGPETGAIPKRKKTSHEINSKVANTNIEAPIDVASIPLPSGPPASSSDTQLVYDPWEDTTKNWTGPLPPLRPPPGTKESEPVKKDEEPKSDLWKLVNKNQKQNKNKNQGDHEEKLSKRQIKRRRRSAEKEEKKKKTKV